MASANDETLRKLQEKHGEGYVDKGKSNREENDKNDDFNRKNDQTRKQRFSDPKILGFQHLVSHNSVKKKDFTGDRQLMECESCHQTQQNQEGESMVVTWTIAAAASEGDHLCVPAESTNGDEYQDHRSTYLYDGDPLQDPRFTRLIELLVPLRTQLPVERKTLLDSNRKGNFNAHYRSNEICLRDICLNDTCRLLFKIMNKGSGNGDFQKE